jgi:hypothetical protein
VASPNLPVNLPNSIRSRLDGAEKRMKQAALGFRVHSGWAAVVAVGLEKGMPSVLARARVRLVETFSYTFRQPYHTAEKMALEEGRAFIAGVRMEARRLAQGAIRRLQSEIPRQGYKLTRCGLLLASGRPLPDLEKVLASHALIHTADGELFREAILHASGRCGLREFTIKDKELLDVAGRTLRVKPADLLRRAAELGRPLSAPWSQDEKFAALVAWLASKAPAKNAFIRREKLR